MYDIIADVHGHADELEYLLEKLEYKKKANIYEHQHRKAIFVGDYINRGKKVRKTIEIVKNMVDNGQALAILGNHDFHLLQHFSPTLRLDNRPGFNLQTIARLATTATDFRDDEDAFFQHVNWLEQLPFYIETEHIRIVHAAWIPDHIRQLNVRFANQCTAKRVLQDMDEGGDHFQDLIMDLITGIHVPPSNQDKSPSPRDKIRLRWWLDPQTSKPRDLTVRPMLNPVELNLPEKLLSKFYPYSSTEKPIFFGHYCLAGQPRLIASNICCVDFCVAKQRRLCAYRWNGESVLDKKNFVW